MVTSHWSLTTGHCSLVITHLLRVIFLCYWLLLTFSGSLLTFTGHCSLFVDHCLVLSRLLLTLGWGHCQKVARSLCPFPRAILRNQSIRALERLSGRLGHNMRSSCINTSNTHLRNRPFHLIVSAQARCSFSASFWLRAWGKSHMSRRLSIILDPDIVLPPAPRMRSLVAQILRGEAVSEHLLGA
jgi:hypothetical protein